MDAVELILKIEDAFAIRITDEEAGQLTTVGDIHDLIVSKLGGPRESNRCLTSAAFYRLRRALVQTLGTDRARVKPSTALEDLMPEQDRRAKWQKIESAAGLRLPTLERPGWVQAVCLMLGAGGAVATGISLGASVGIHAVLLLAGVVFAWFLMRMAGSLAVAFPHGDRTVGDLARDLLTKNYGRLAEQTGSSNERDAWETLCRLIVIQTGVDRARITRDARIARDLGID